MKRDDIEIAAEEYFKGLPCPEPDEITEFVIQQIKKWCNEKQIPVPEI